MIGLQQIRAYVCECDSSLFLLDNVSTLAGAAAVAGFDLLFMCEIWIKYSYKSHKLILL